MPADKETSSSTLSDLVSVELSSQDSVQVVERSEIDRVLKEQDMNAAGLTDVKSRIALGKLLKADGFLFLEKSAKDDRISARLVETVQGFQVGYAFYPTEKTSTEELAKNISVDTLKLIPKLSLDPSKRKLVSIIRIGNATLSSDYNWIEDEFPAALSAMLSVHPEIIVLERRQLGRLFDEAKLTEAGETEFAGGAYLLDGEVSITKNVPLKEGDTPLTFTVRIRNSNLRELARAEVNGSINALDELFARTASLTQEKIAALGRQDTTSTETESELLHNMARKYNLLWAAEGAHALSPANKDFAKDMVLTLINTPLQSTSARCSTDEEFSRPIRALARAQSICRANGKNIFAILTPQQKVNLIRILNSSRALTDAKTSSALMPIRSDLRSYPEERLKPNQPLPVDYLRDSEAFFDDPLEHNTYTIALFENVLNSTSITDEERINQAFSIVQQCSWPPNVYVDLLDRVPDNMKWFILGKLMQYTQQGSKKEIYAETALPYLIALLNRPSLVRILAQRDLLTNTYRNILLQTITDVMECLPKRKDDLSKAYCRCCYNILRLPNGLDIMCRLEQIEFLKTIEPYAALQLVDRFLLEMSRCDPTVQATQQIRFFRNRFGNLRKELIAKNHLVCDRMEKRSLLLLSGDDSRLESALSTFYPPGVMDAREECHLLTPQRLLLHGKTLFVGFGGEPMSYHGSNNTIHSSGLLRLDITTGTIMSYRFGFVTGGRGNALPRQQRTDQTGYYCRSLTPMVLNDHVLCFAQNKVGVLFFPLANNLKALDLNGVTVVHPEDGLVSDRYDTVCFVGKLAYVLCQIFHNDSSAVMQIDWRRRTTSLFMDSESTLSDKDVPERWKTVAMSTGPTSNHLTVDIMPFTRHDDNWIGSGLLTYECDVSSRVWKSVTTDSKARAKEWNDEKAKIQDAKDQLPPALELDYDILAYEGGQLAIVGYGKHWSIEFFPGSNTPPDTLAWAPPSNSDKRDRPAPEPLPALIEAVNKQDLTTLKELLSRGENINIQDKNGWTPLLHAISSNATDCAVFLIESGADVDLATKAGCSPLCFAADGENMDVARRLLDKNADVNQSSGTKLTPIYLAVARGCTDMVKLFIEKGANVNSRRTDLNHWTPIFGAATEGHLDTVQLLLDSGVNVDQRDRLGRTVMIETAFRSHPDVIKLLIERGADVRAKDRNGCSALLAAIMGGCGENVRLLAEQGLDIHSPMPGQYGRTPLMHAAWKSSPDVVQALIDLGADVNYQTDDGATALMFAAGANRPENIQVLLDAGADVMHVECDRIGRSSMPLDRATTPEARALMRFAIGNRMRESQ